MLRPLEQWFCDTCGQVIEEPDHGYVEWHPDFGAGNGERGFRIVHHKTHSPLGGQDACYYGGRSSSLALRRFLGSEGLVTLLSFLDVGPYLQPEYPGPRAGDLREFTEFVRRLQVPFYEEARRYWEAARDDGYFDGANEVWMYLPKTLEKLILTYGPRERRPRV